ncbi:MAG: TetR/AcrR family transcriptional regulator [Mycobacterium sp.]|jgi:AcrR family transcriptional regulator|uniref:TetR/AcrR family transcriptional regulator n=1 Tax=Mycobacterium sp. TaxID=1785 RepID=UPI0026133B8D|nr:TetR/AcrR family transcriptional regulator [Mycobacterium sp.]MCW2659511.1 TetR/AcrR family transcriptional regulator [Mycobacterium sp.]
MSMVRPAKRPGGRTAAVSSAIKTAVEQLVAEKGRDKVSIPMVAERAGVNPTTVYRRWPDAASMINNIATYHLDPARPLPDTGDLHSDIAAWATEILHHYRKPVNAALLRGGAAAAGDDESDCLRGRLDEVVHLLGRAGEQSPVTEQDIVDGVLAPIMYRIIFLPSTLTDDYAETLTAKLFND